MGLASDDKVERVMRGHLHDALEGQRGRAAAAFRARVSAGRGSKGAAVTASSRGWRWLAIAVPLAAAACAVLAIHPLTGGRTTPSQGGRPAAVAKAEAAPLLDDVTLSRDVDGGTIVMEDHTPARVLVEQQLRHTQWFDPKEKAVMSVTKPDEKIRFVALQPY